MPHHPGPSLTDFPPDFATSASLRSEFLRRLFVAPPAAEAGAAKPVSAIPRVLVRFWDDHATMPGDVAACLDSWEPLRQAGFDIRTFDDATAAAHIADAHGPREAEAFRRCHHPAMRSDFFRLCYILAAGGLYVDADDAMTEGAWPLLYANDRLKLQPLSFDIPSQSMVEVQGFWRFDRPRPDRTYYVNNNPLAAPPGHPLLRRALARATGALLAGTGPLEIQATTGPGNLTIALAEHAHARALAGLAPDYEMIRDWDRVGRTRWALSYRDDHRNWRHANGG